MRLDDNRLLEWVEGRLSPEQDRAVARACAADPERAAVAENLRAASRLPIREAFDRTAVPPVPPTLETAVRLLVANTTLAPAGSTMAAGEHHACPGTRRILYRVVQTVVLAVVAIGVGLIGYELGRQDAMDSIRWAMAAATTSFGRGDDDERRWARRIAEHQSLHVRATLENGPADPADTRALLQRLFERTGLDPRVPDLSRDGYRFVRAGELGWEGAPLIQLVYLAADGPPLALCCMPDTDPDHELRIRTHAGLVTGTWRREGRRLVLVGDVSQARLRSLSRRVDDTLATPA